MRAFYCCIACIVVIDAEKVDRFLGYKKGGIRFPCSAEL
jgi:hypothetical protein